MSSTVSHETNEMLVELLAGEKEDARVWLQAEMDRLVGPFVDSIFNRLQTKLTNGLAGTQSGDGGDSGELMIPTEHDQLANDHLTHLANDNPLPSSSTHLSTPNPTSFHLHPPNVQSRFTFPTSVSSQPVSITSITLPNELTNVQSQCPMPIKHEIEVPSANEPIAESNQNLDYLDDEDEEEEECYCEDCVNGGLELEIKLDDDDDSDDSVELIEYEEDQEQSSRPVKKPRLDTTQPNNEQTEVIGEPLGQATQPNQVNSHDKQIITLSLRCPESNCPGTFSGDRIVTQLSDHLWHGHSIKPFRCLVKDCRQSFENTRILGDHLKQSHQSTTQWHCDKCSKHFTEYKILSSHNFQLHQIGHFQCTFPSCTFTGEYRAKVFNHYTQQHRRTLSCRHSDCPFLASSSSDLKRHERSHLGIKPYRCRWPDCQYAATQRSHTIGHIRTQHLAPNPGHSVPNGAQLDPSDYLEVVHELL